MASYEPTRKPGIAEVAFAVPDDMHGHGIATLLLEHLVSIARDRGVQAFTAETLAENTAMLTVFADAGLPVQRQTGGRRGGADLPAPGRGGRPQPGAATSTPWPSGRAGRTWRACGICSRPASVAVVGASRRRGTMGREILRNIVTGGFSGEVYPVNPRAARWRACRAWRRSPTCRSTWTWR